MMGLLDHAEKEFELAGWKDAGVDKSQEWVMDNIRELLTVFSKQGHSGSSAPYVLNLFSILARFEIITPLTGADEEWMDVSGGIYQNKRDSRVFKENGKAYFIDGKAFSRDGGETFFTNYDSRVPVVFPCEAENLKTEYVLLTGEVK